MKKVRIGTRDYYKLEQVPAIDNDDSDLDICTGCVFHEKQPVKECPRDVRGDVKCKTYTETRVIEHIFIPATRAGLTAFAIHRLENS